MNIKKVAYIILVIVWMITMFLFSNQQGTGSSSTSRKASEIVVNIMNIKKQYTDLEKEEIVKQLEPIVRKLAHYVLYAIGGILIANCVYQFVINENRLILTSAIIGMLYSISDEMHQLIIPGRSGNIKDVIIDSIGILTGIALFLLAKEIIKMVIVKMEKTKEV